MEQWERSKNIKVANSKVSLKILEVRITSGYDIKLHPRVPLSKDNTLLAPLQGYGEAVGSRTMDSTKGVYTGAVEAAFAEICLWFYYQR